jgi:hypothetical protein
MPRDGALTLSDVGPTLTIVCGPCAWRGRYAVARLLEAHGDVKLTDLPGMLADCPTANSASVYDRCRAVYEGLAAGKPPGSIAGSRRRTSGARPDQDRTAH